MPRNVCGQRRRNDTDLLLDFVVIKGLGPLEIRRNSAQRNRGDGVGWQQPIGGRTSPLLLRVHRVSFDHSLLSSSSYYSPSLSMRRPMLVNPRETRHSIRNQFEALQCGATRTFLLCPVPNSHLEEISSNEATSMTGFSPTNWLDYEYVPAMVYTRSST